MLKKDKEKRKNVASKSDKRAYEEAAKRIAQEAEDREKLVPGLSLSCSTKIVTTVGI